MTSKRKKVMPQILGRKLQAEEVDSLIREIFQDQEDLMRVMQQLFAHMEIEGIGCYEAFEQIDFIEPTLVKLIPVKMARAGQLPDQFWDSMAAVLVSSVFQSEDVT